MTKTKQDQLAEMLPHFDLLDSEAQRVKWALFEHARTSCPIAHTDANGGSWLVTRYDDVRQVLEDWQTFSSTQSPFFAPGVSLCPIDEDPPVQTAVRQLLNPLFSRTALAAYEPDMRAAARQLMDQFVARGSCEFLGEYSGPFTGSILTKIVFDDLGSDELGHAMDLVRRVAEGGTAEVFAELFGLCTEYLRRAKSKPSEKDGVVTRVINAEVDGVPLAEPQQIGILAVLMLGGLDTSRAAMGSIVYHMTQDPAIEERLRDPRWVRRDFDEFIRLNTPVAVMARVATRDVEFGDAKIKKGERVQVRFDSANRDETRFHDADSLVFGEARTGHVGFGVGIHRCIGSNLARLQIEIGLNELLARVTNIRLAPGAEIEWPPGQINALHRLDIEFDRLESSV